MAKPKVKPLTSQLEKFKIEANQALLNARSVEGAIRGSKEIQQATKQLKRKPITKKISDDLDTQIEKIKEDFIQATVQLAIEEGFASEEELKKIEQMARKSMQSGLLNKGRMLELKIYILAGLLDDFELGDNLAGFAGGDVNLVLDFKDLGFSGDSNSRVVQGQIKDAKSEFSLPLEFSENQKKQFAQHLKGVLSKIADQKVRTRVGRNLVEGFNDRTKIIPQKATEAMGLALRHSHEARDNVEVKKEFFKRYVELSAANYYLMGFSAQSLSSFVFSIPHYKMLSFVEKHSDAFKDQSKKKDRIIYRYTGGFNTAKSAFPEFLTSPSLTNNYHIHSLAGYKHFTTIRNSVLSDGQIDSHRRFLVKDWENFLVPHMYFDPGNLDKYKLDIKTLRRFYG